MLSTLHVLSVLITSCILALFSFVLLFLSLIWIFIRSHFFLSLLFLFIFYFFSLFIFFVEYYVHVYMRSDGLCGCVTCDSEYPPRVAFTILTKILEDFDAQNPTWKTGTCLFLDSWAIRFLFWFILSIKKFLLFSKQIQSLESISKLYENLEMVLQARNVSEPDKNSTV